MFSLSELDELTSLLPDLLRIVEGYCGILTWKESKADDIVWDNPEIENPEVSHLFFLDQKGIPDQEKKGSLIRDAKSGDIFSLESPAHVLCSGDTKDRLLAFNHEWVVWEQHRPPFPGIHCISIENEMEKSQFFRLDWQEQVLFARITPTGPEFCKLIGSTLLIYSTSQSDPIEVFILDRELMIVAVALTDKFIFVVSCDHLICFDRNTRDRVGDVSIECNSASMKLHVNDRYLYLENGDEMAIMTHSLELIDRLKLASPIVGIDGQGNFYIGSSFPLMRYTAQKLFSP